MVKFQTVAAFTFPIEAYLAKGRLEAEGIPAWIVHENHVWANWMYSQALGGVKLQVLENNFEAAHLVLEKHLKGAYENDLNSEFPDIPDIEENHCPQCGAKHYESRLSLLSLITVLLTFGVFTIIFPLKKKHHNCLECGFNWKH